MNTSQKVCIAIGTAIIALILLVFPATKEAEVPARGFSGVHGGTKIVDVTDYPATAMRALGVAIATGALAMFLGVKKRRQKRREERRNPRLNSRVLYYPNLQWFSRLGTGGN